MSTSNLPVTQRVSETILCLPIYSDMPIAYVEKVCTAIRDIYASNLYNYVPASTDISQPSKLGTYMHRSVTSLLVQYQTTDQTSKEEHLDGN